MADTETLDPHGIIIPGLDEMHAEAIPGQLKRMARSFEDGLVGYAVDAVDRNARFGGLPKGALVSSYGSDNADQFLWRKTGTGATAWVTVWRNPRDMTNAVQFVGNTWVPVANEVHLSGNGIGTLYLSVEYNGPDLGVGSASGDLPNQLIGNAPAPWRPKFDAPLQPATRGVMCMGWFTPAGDVSLNAVVPIRGLLNGDIIQLAGTFVEVL